MKINEAKVLKDLYYFLATFIQLELRLNKCRRHFFYVRLKQESYSLTESWPISSHAHR